MGVRGRTFCTIYNSGSNTELKQYTHKKLQVLVLPSCARPMLTQEKHYLIISLQNMDDRYKYVPNSMKWYGRLALCTLLPCCSLKSLCRFSR